jgi:hypothetical protein
MSAYSGPSREMGKTYTTRTLHPVFADLGWLEEEENRDTVPGLFQSLVRARRNLNVGVLFSVRPSCAVSTGRVFFMW